MATRYNLAERMVWAKTPDWKRQVIVRCKLTKTEDRLLDEYAHEIVQLAETETLLNDKLPPVPAFTMESETPQTAANPS